MTHREKVIRFIEEYIRVPDEVLVNQPIKLSPFQKQFIIDVYDNTQSPTTSRALPGGDEDDLIPKSVQ